MVLEGAGFANAANAGRRMDRRGALHYVCALLLVGEKSEEFRLDQSYKEYLRRIEDTVKTL